MVEHADEIESFRSISFSSWLTAGACPADHIGDKHCVEYPHSELFAQVGGDADSVLRLFMDAHKLS